MKKLITNYELRITNEEVINGRDLVKVLVVGKDEVVNLKTVSIYDRPNQVGNVLVKAVVTDNGILNLVGLIRIEKGAKLVEAFLRQNVLLLGENARATTEPELEIETDEVKASHAATVGDIDEEQLFYLESRGLSKNEAKKMIVESFLEDALGRIDKREAEEIRSKISQWQA